MHPPIHIFIAYSREDAEFVKELRKHLTPLERDETIKLWHDREIAAGEDWNETILDNLRKADIVLLLLSPDSLASNYFYGIEVENALKRHDANECRVVPVIVRDCLWEETSLANLQALPKDAKHIAKWKNPDSAYKSIAVGVTKLVEDIKTERKAKEQASSKDQEKALKEQAEQKAVKEQAEREARKQAEQKAKEQAAKEQAERERQAAIDPFFDQMIWVEGGVFEMGSNDGDSDEKPVHKVSVNSFYLSRYPVTQAQWRQVMGSYPPELYNENCDQCPVERVSWLDAQAFIEQLNRQTGKKYRLPTEAEWEYAALGGKKSKGYQYAGSNNIEEVAWYGGNHQQSKHGSKGTTHPVGTKNPNELGIYDMSGNVWEWCSSLYKGYPYKADDGREDLSASGDRVCRGGSWGHDARFCRLANRISNHPDNGSNRIGFRLAVAPV